MILTKDEVVKMARQVWPEVSAGAPMPDGLERFATLCRAPLVAENAALKQEQTGAVPVVEQLVEALCELVQSDGLPRTLEQLDASVKKAFAAIAAGQTFIKESKHA